MASHKKLNSQTVVIFCSSYAFIAINIFYSLAAGDFSYNEDAYNYYLGFRSIASISGSTFYTHFGEFPEFAFQLIYYMFSFLIPAEPWSVFFINSFIFSSTYLGALFILRRYLLGLAPKSQLAINSFLVLLMALCPPGISQQLSRQAFAFAVLSVILSLTINWKKKTALIFSTIFIHRAVFLSAIAWYLLSKHYLKFFVLFLSIFILISIWAHDYLLLFYEHPTLRLRAVEPFSRTANNVAFFVTCVFLIFRFSWRNFFFAVIGGLLAAYPFAFFYRMMFGIEYWILLTFMFLETIRKKKNEHLLAIVMLLLAVGFFTIKILVTGFEIFA